MAKHASAKAAAPSCPHCAATNAANEALQIKVETLQECSRGEDKFISDAAKRFGMSPQEAIIISTLFTRERVTHEGLYIALYGDYDCDVDMKIILVLMSKIRKKLTPLGIEIETLWGEGYRIKRDSKETMAKLMKASPVE